MQTAIGFVLVAVFVFGPTFFLLLSVSDPTNCDL